MSPLKADDLHRIFKELDKDGDGLVRVDELKTLFERIGVHANLDELQSLVGKTTTTLDSIDFFIFYDTIIKENNCDQSQANNGGVNSFDYSHLVQAFKVFDLDGDGFISSDELRSVLSRFGLLDDHGAPDCKSMINKYDINSDGKLDLEEFKNMMFPSNT